MISFRSTTLVFACFLSFNAFCIVATTTSTSTSEQLFWTQALQTPGSDLTATVILASQTSTSGSLTSPTTTSTPTPDPNICNATSISCPACNDVDITVTQNKTYHVLCDNKLYSDSPYPVQRWLNAPGCIAECDKYPWCKGATSWEEGNCQLARGENVFPQEDEGHIAMLQIPEGFVAPEPATVPSAFPTGNLPPASSTASASASASRAPKPEEEAGKCALRDIACPSSRGERVTDGFNATYTVRCNFQPMCNEFVSIRGRQTKCGCLAQCDKDPTCLAALFNRGKCDLCQGSLEGLSTYTSPRQYMVFVSEAPEIGMSMTSTTLSSKRMGMSSSRPRMTPSSISISKPSASSTTTSRPRTSISTPSSGRSLSSTRRTTSVTSPRSSSRSATITRPPQATTGSSKSSLITFSPSLPPQQPAQNPAHLDPISSAVCPSWDNADVYSPRNDRNYIVQCDASFGAAISNIASAEDFAGCAGECDEQCGGVDFNDADVEAGEEAGCTLFTGISVIQSQAGPTAGVWVRFPGTVPADLATMTTSTTMELLTTTSAPNVASSATSTATGVKT